MTVITQNIADITGADDNTAWVFYVKNIRDSGNGNGIITTRKIRAYPAAGVLTVDLDPGPAVVAAVDGNHYAFTVPESDSALWPLIQAEVTIPPGTRHEELEAAVAAWLDTNPMLWNSIPGKPAVIAEGATAAEARTAIGAVDQAAVTAAVDAVIAGAPGALDTLNELAAALGDDANFAATITTALATNTQRTDEAWDYAQAGTVVGEAVRTAADQAAGRNAVAALGLIQAAKNPDLLVTGAVTVDGNDLITSAAVVWPDGTPGTLTITSRDANNAVLAYNITYGNPMTKTYTQPPITRNANGAATNIPAIVVS